MSFFTAIAYIIVNCNSVFQIVALLIVAVTAICFAAVVLIIVTRFLLHYGKTEFIAGRNGISLKACEHKQ